MIPSSEVRSNLYIHSYVMDMDIRYSIWLPPAYDENESYPVLYLLHGYEQPPEDSHNCWLSKGNLDALATQYALEGGELFLIVTPNGQNSFYMDDFDDRHLKYGTFFWEEFIPQIETAYGGNGKRAIAGLSMGGFGAMYHCLTFPEKITYAYACSPALWGLGALVKSSDTSRMPGITLETGTEDKIISPSSVTSFSSLLSDKGIDHELITRDGDHSWTFWQECLPKILKRVGESFR